MVAKYVSQRHPSIKVALGDKRFQFKDGVLDLEDEADIAELDKQIATRGDISANIKKVDKEAAEAVARAHKAEMIRQSQAQKGATTSEALHQMRPQTALDKALSEADPQTAADLSKKLADDAQFVATQQTEQPSVPDPAPAEQVKTVGKTLNLKK